MMPYTVACELPPGQSPRVFNPDTDRYRPAGQPADRVSMGAADYNLSREAAGMCMSHEHESVQDECCDHAAHAR
jgi:hypothetical protein